MPNNDLPEFYIHSAAIDMASKHDAADIADIFPELSSPAQTMYENIVERIKKFEAALPNDKQAGGCLVSAPSTVFLINKVTYADPDVIIFMGALSDGSSVELLQHVSQVNLLMVAVSRTDNLDQPRREIGFRPIKKPTKP